MGSIGAVIVDHIYYWTRDLGRAVAFYTDVVGLPLVRRDGNEWAVRFMDRAPADIDRQRRLRGERRGETEEKQEHQPEFQHRLPLPGPA